MRTRFANGAHYGAYAPLGYVKDPDKKGHLLIDPETRWIVEKIFDLAVHGRGAASITRILVEEKVPTPGWLNYGKYPRSHHFRRSVPKSSGADCKQTQATEEWHNANIFRASKMCGLRMVIGLWCKQPEQKSLCTLPLQ